MNDNTIIGLPWDWREQSRKSTLIMFRGKVMSVYDAELELLFEESERRCNTDPNTSLIDEYLIHDEWKEDYLKSINWNHFTGNGKVIH